jgi:hypothetical protein
MTVALIINVVIAALALAGLTGALVRSIATRLGDVGVVPTGARMRRRTRPRRMPTRWPASISA